MRVAYTRRIETSIYTHERERERERERKGQQREHGTTKFSAYPSFPLFRSLAGREEKFLLPKSCHDEGMKYKKSYCRKRSRGASSTSRGERRKRKKEEKCRTRQLFLPFFFFPRLFIISSSFSNRRCRAPVDRKNFVAQWLIQATLYRERQLLTDATRVRAQLFPNYAGRGTLWR